LLNPIKPHEDIQYEVIATFSIAIECRRENSFSIAHHRPLKMPRSFVFPVHVGKSAPYALSLTANFQPSADIFLYNTLIQLSNFDNERFQYFCCRIMGSVGVPRERVLVIYGSLSSEVEESIRETFADQDLTIYQPKPGEVTPPGQ